MYVYIYIYIYTYIYIYIERERRPARRFPTYDSGSFNRELHGTTCLTLLVLYGLIRFMCCVVASGISILLC